MTDKTSETKANEGGKTRIWTGVLCLRDGRTRKMGDAVTVKIIVLSQSVVIEFLNEDRKQWEPADPFDVHPDSLLRALGATGSEVG